jgi:cobalt-zinc-cadmium efflux system outer membrane protein
MAAARAALAATKGSRADVERTLELTVKQQVLQAELAKQSLVYANQAQTLAGDTLRIVQIRYKAGAVSQADVARASVQKLEADQASDLAQQTFDVARAGLAFLLGYRETPADLDVADDLMQGGRLESLPYTKESLLATALARRPDLQAARFQIERAQSSMALAKRLRLPDLFPSLQYSRESPPTFAFGVSLAPPLLYRYGGEVAKAEADLRSQELTAQKIEAQVGADVSSAFAAFTGARSRAERARTDLLAASGRARDLVRLQYEKGAASLFEFLDAQRTFLAAQNESLQALDDYWTAVFQLEQATAMELHR